MKKIEDFRQRHRHTVLEPLIQRLALCRNLYDLDFFCFTIREAQLFLGLPDAFLAKGIGNKRKIVKWLSSPLANPTISERLHVLGRIAEVLSHQLKVEVKIADPTEAYQKADKARETPDES
jgi:hypothetical protein